MSPDSREVYVLSDFKDSLGNERVKGEVFVVAYTNERQRRQVNALVHRGYLTFDVAGAQQHAQANKPRKAPVKRVRKKTDG